MTDISRKRHGYWRDLIADWRVVVFTWRALTRNLFPSSIPGHDRKDGPYVTSWSNALWRELQGTGVTVTCLMPGAMRTGFADAGGLSDTKLFANAVDPMAVAQDGYDAMLAGKLNCTSGLVSWQRPLMKLQPLFPKKMMLNFVYNQQIAGSAKK
jgi:hypothetical protein